MINLISSSFFSCPKSNERENQDSILPVKMIHGYYIFAIADGVGSYNGAKEASISAISYLNEIKKPHVNMYYIFNEIRRRIIKLSEQNKEYDKAATTLTLGILGEKGLEIGHIGDCRLYFRDGLKLKQLTKDHTQHQRLLDLKLYSKKELRELSGKNVINKALAGRLEPDFDYTFIPIKELLEEDNSISIYLMSDGAHAFWEKRPRFSLNTISKPDAFSASLRRRIEKDIQDDYSLIALKFQINEK
ncbi:protein phosphatase 2C domain-containing protein [Pasteurella multocida]|uniref:PP2C family protein-serine/threonine phosphatase n=1 Tax=Pasteurella multocida TaxID=747 RepID=UPI002020B5E7|nr:protein phosphatase 2C domain-containing protein [Pasteurella multocida]MCL7815255.1 protein phosphatase 2C domain-containing protein [Pasteurella multocida]MDY0640396.1 protein phosphatase 2C domain-containing protein [Pasteurella multocida]HDR1026121.1 protein phosphatase 2C domain-containing protein [Pasteurella multocida]